MVCNSLFGIFGGIGKKVFGWGVDVNEYVRNMISYTCFQIGIKC